MLTRLFSGRSSVFSFTSKRSFSSAIQSQHALSRLMHQQTSSLLLPVGYESFQEVSQKKKLSSVDKSLFIKDVLDDESTKTVVITRPRCFGKTYILSMLHCFLSSEVDGQKTTELFDNLKITSLGEEYMQHQGKYPVILINFKDVGQTKFQDTYTKLYELIIKAYEQHDYLANSIHLTKRQKNLYKILIEGKATPTQLENSIKVLIECLFKHHQVKPWLLVDEYDTPLQIGFTNNYYEEIVKFMRSLLGTALKSNSALEKSVMMGIFQINKENLFSGINNLTVYSLLSGEYNEHFGFTESEVAEILEKSNLKEKSELIKSWYNGYHAGNTLMYNPLSIASCVKYKGAMTSYWANTSDNQLIRDLLTKSPISLKKEFILLLRGESIEKFINEDVAFQNLNQNLSSIWTLLLMGGYLKQISYRVTEQGTFARLAIPNQEILNLYRQMIEQWLSNNYGIQWYNDFINTLLSGETRACKKYLEEIIRQIVNVKNSKENPDEFYHGLLLGLTASLYSTGMYEIKSYQESKKGNCEIILIPKNSNALGIIILLKHADQAETITEASKAALQKIDEMRSVEELNARGIHQIMKMGLGLREEYLEVSSAKETIEQQDRAALKCR